MLELTQAGDMYVSLFGIFFGPFEGFLDLNPSPRGFSPPRGLFQFGCCCPGGRLVLQEFRNF
jgi:hypothetical protein